MIKKTKWYGLNICVNCETLLTFNQQMHSGGICPFCGNDGNSTICDTRKVILRKITEKGNFFKRARYTFEGKDNFSEQWVNPK